MENKLLTSVSLAAFLFTVACGAFKPDHPQVYQSFKDRRAPKENVLAESGALAKSGTKNESSFRPYSGKSTVTTASDSTQSMQKNNDMFNSHTPVTVNNNKTAGAEQQPTAKSEKDSDSLLDRLFKWLNAGTSSTVEVAYLDKRMPSENIHARHYNIIPDEQGSANSYSYYDIAQDIDSATGEFGQITDPNNAIEIAQTAVMPAPVVTDPVPPAPMAAPVQSSPAPVTAQPLIEVPKEPSMDEMKTHSATQPQPDLKNIPQPPKEFTKQPNVTEPKAKKIKNPKTKKPAKHRKAKPVKPQRQHVTSTDNYGSPDELSIKDRTSSLQYIDGKPVVTGYLAGCDQ